MRTIKGIGKFFLVMTAFLLLGAIISPTDKSTGTVIIPDGYVIICSIASIFLSALDWSSTKAKITGFSPNASDNIGISWRGSYEDYYSDEDLQDGLNPSVIDSEKNPEAQTNTDDQLISIVGKCAKHQAHSPVSKQPTKPVNVDYDAILKEEEIWRRAQMGLPPVEYELHKVDTMEGHAFERYCADLLKKDGFENIQVTSQSRDKGVDILAEKYDVRYAFQCKCSISDIGISAVQEINTGKSIYNCHIGIVITNRYFTSGAIDAAEATGVRLWNREKLIELIKLL